MTLFKVRGADRVADAINRSPLSFSLLGRGAAKCYDGTSVALATHSHSKKH